MAAGLFTAAAAAMLATFAWTGHAGVGNQVPLAVLSDVAHLSAMSLWLGGLVQLVAVLPQVEGPVAPRMAASFSRVAAVSVAVLVVSGSYQSWRQAGVLDSLGTTYYGRLLLLKVGLVLATLAVAAGSRRWVIRHRERTVVSAHVDVQPGLVPTDTRSDVGSVAALRRSVLAEAVLVVAVLGVTSFLGLGPAGSRGPSGTAHHGRTGPGRRSGDPPADQRSDGSDGGQAGGRPDRCRRSSDAGRRA